MSPKLKPLLLPQLVDQRHKTDSYQPAQASADAVDPSDVYYYTVNSSSSDITSPVTPVFSPKGHQRFSSSTSSLEVTYQPPSECPASPSQTSSTISSVAQLPDVEEEPIEQEETEETEKFSDKFGLYHCLCDRQPCSHRGSVEDIFPGGFVPDFDIDYDMGFLSDGDLTEDTSLSRKKRNAAEATFSDLTARLGSRMPTIRRWRSSKRATLRKSPTSALNVENVQSRTPSVAQSLSTSALANTDRFDSPPPPPLPNGTLRPSYDFDEAGDAGVGLGIGVEMTFEEQTDLERDRAMATTPLLPPLLMDVFGRQPRESPLQSPKVALSPVMDGAMSPPMAVRPPLSTRPSMTSLRNVSGSGELPLPLPTILQEHDEWSDRLGHANFTITPQPYEVDAFGPDSLAKFRSDWDLARINYTKHLVRTGENYGQTSKIYALTEAKWAETERRWQSTFEEIVKHTCHSAPQSASVSRNQSRVRGRGRSSSSNAAAIARLQAPHGQEYVLAELEWQRAEDCLPSAVPQMLESLDADGKFPGLGDEDIVGPMQRDAVMMRTRSEESKGRFWKSLADRVGLRK